MVEVKCFDLNLICIRKGEWCHFDRDSDKHWEFSSVNNAASKSEVKDSSCLISTVNLSELLLGSFSSLKMYLFGWLCVVKKLEHIWNMQFETHFLILNDTGNLCQSKDYFSELGSQYLEKKYDKILSFTQCISYRNIVNPSKSQAVKTGRISIWQVPFLPAGTGGIPWNPLQPRSACGEVGMSYSEACCTQTVPYLSAVSSAGTFH